MAINKVVNKSTKSHGAMRNVIEYVLRDDKIKEGYVEITGPFSADVINYDEVYKSWKEEKQIWNKDSGRMYSHNIISFHAEEKVTPEEVLEIGKQFAEQFFPDNQCLIGVHQDKDHLHCHIVTNTVSYIDGHKLHQTKKDLQKQKDFTNELCRERGLSVAEKGKHFDGSAIEEGEIIAWGKDKYNLLRNEAKKSYVAECAIAVMESVPRSASREEFISCMEERGWSVRWEDKRKHITFENENGDKVRDSNLEKTFTMDVNKEALLYEFERQNELRREREKYRHEQEQQRIEQQQLAGYYAEIERVSDGLGTETAGTDTATRIDHSNASVREAETRRRISELERKDSETERRERDAEREIKKTQPERQRTGRKQKDPGLSR